jgi:hypothetical protein
MHRIEGLDDSRENSKYDRIFGWLSAGASFLAVALHHDLTRILQPVRSPFFMENTEKKRINLLSIGELAPLA